MTAQLHFPDRACPWAGLLVAAFITIADRQACAAVIESWTQRYDGPAHGDDQGNAVAVDRSGNVVVSGRSYNGNNYDFYTAKYAATNGLLLWEKRYNAPGNLDDEATAVAVDNSGNVVVTGFSGDAGTNNNYYTAKYAAASGALLWENRGPGGALLAVDSSGNVVVAGSSHDGTNFQYYTAKYASPDGALLWERRDGATHGDYYVTAMVLDGEGNVAVTGYTWPQADYYTAKYARVDGARLWERRYDGPANGEDRAQALAVDGSGNVVVTGSSHNGTNDDYYTAKYAAGDGALLWERRYNGPANGQDSASAVAVDASGNVVVTGSSRNDWRLAEDGTLHRDYDYYTAKYAAADGAQVWEQRYNGPGNSDDSAVAVAVDGSGNVVVTGNSGGCLDCYTGDCLTVKYAAADGSVLWEKRYNGPANGEDRVGSSASLALGPKGMVAITAAGDGSFDSGFNHDYATVVYQESLPPFLTRQQAYLKASNTGADDVFGQVAISGDTLVVGAHQEDSNAIGINGNQANNSATDSGAAYVFVRDGTNWSQQSYLKASNAGAGDYFGVSTAVSGDTLVVGAPRESSNATGVNGDQSNNSALYSGAAYVFVRNGTNWTQQAYLKASNAGGGDSFGYSVAISGNTVVVGAASEDSNANGVNGNQSNNSVVNAGAAYVFVRSGTNWSQQAYLKASNPGLNDEFGSCVSISGDTVVVGAEGEASNATGVNGNQSDNSASYAGAAYVFVRSGTNWSQQAYLKASNTGPGDEFGLALAVSGDTVVVGAHHENSNGIGTNGSQNNAGAEHSGAAYIFVRSGTDWTQQAYLKASNSDIGDEFGDRVAASGDVVVVSTGGESSNATGVNGDQSDNSAPIAGAAYVFVRQGTNWTQQAYLKASNTEAYDEFGARVAVSGDTVVVGAFSESSNATGVNGNQNDNSAAASGAVYVFTGSGPSASQLNIRYFPGNVRLFWPLSGENFVLDEANDLNAAPTNNWTQVPFPYQTNATDVSVTLPLSSGNKFYRLRQP